MPKGIYPRKKRTRAEVLASLRMRLETNSIPEPNSGCWIFTGYVDAIGYGCIAESRNIHIKAHRASYTAFRGEIPDGLDIMHSCDVRCCVNPDHLRPGTHAENMADMAAKGRAPSARGEKSVNAKLTEAAVRNIRARFISTRALARKHGVSARTIGDIQSRKRWRHVT